MAQSCRLVLITEDHVMMTVWVSSSWQAVSMETLPREHLVARQALPRTPRGKNRSLQSSFRFAQHQTVTDEFKHRNEGWPEWICLLLYPKQSLFSSAKGWQIRKGQRIDKPIILEAMIRLIEALCVWQYGRKEVLDTSVKLTFIAFCSPLGKKPLEMVSSA